LPDDQTSHLQDRSITAGALYVGYLGSLLLSLYLGRQGAQSSAVWTANGFLAGAFILLPWRWRIGAALASLVTELLVRELVGDPWPRLVLYPMVNLLEASSAAWLGLAFCGAQARRYSLARLTLLLVIAIVPAAVVGGTGGGLVDLALGRRDFANGFVAWSIPGALGMTIVLPPVLLIARGRHYRELERSPAEVVGLLAGLCGVTSWVYFQRDLPVQFVIFPTLTLVAARLGPAGAASASFLVAAISLPLVMLGRGPISMASGLDLAGRARVTELVIAAALFTSLTTAVALAEQSRLRRLMIARDRAARLARLRARRAESLAAEYAVAHAQRRLEDTPGVA
jgi:integral membrane sensor domain MASE1